MKICTKCKIPQPLENFSKNKNKKDGRTSQCKLCFKQYNTDNKEQLLIKKKQHYQNNKEQYSLKAKQYREINKEQHSFKMKQYREENKEKIALRDKQHYKKNKEHIMLNIKRWRKTSLGKICRKNADHKRRIVEKQGDVTTVQLRSLLENSTHCFYCNDPLVLNETHIDHYIPLSRGGLHTITNLRVACKKCNLQKGKKMPEDFLLNRGMSIA